MAILNGRLPGLLLHPIGWSPRSQARTDPARAMTALGARFRREFGYYPHITDSYRTYAEQVAVKAAKGYLAATPGTSNHGWGLAFDLGSGINNRGSVQHDWMQRNAKYFGFDNPDWATPGNPRFQKDEPWHWEYVSKANDGSRAIQQMQRIMIKARLYEGVADGWWGGGTEEAWDKLIASVESRSANPKRIQWFQKILASGPAGRLYTGEIDGINGPMTKAAYRALHTRFAGVK
jgi:hypothetical protein